MITPIPRKPHTDANAAEDNAEARMRQALGKLGTASPGKPEASHRASPHQARHGAGRHRFRQDGEVPIVRISLAQGERGPERHAHAPVESAGTMRRQAGDGRDQNSSDTTRQVQELTEQLRTVQTRLGHAELALQEASREAQARQEEAAELRQALDAADTALAQVRAELAASEQAREELEQGRPAARHPRHPDPQSSARQEMSIRRKVGRPLGSTSRVRDQVPGGEPEPVKWWAGD